MLEREDENREGSRGEIVYLLELPVTCRRIDDPKNQKRKVASQAQQTSYLLPFLTRPRGARSSGTVPPHPSPRLLPHPGANAVASVMTAAVAKAAAISLSHPQSPLPSLHCLMVRTVLERKERRRAGRGAKKRPREGGGRCQIPRSTSGKTKCMLVLLPW